MAKQSQKNKGNTHKTAANMISPARKRYKAKDVRFRNKLRRVLRHNGPEAVVAYAEKDVKKTFPDANKKAQAVQICVRVRDLERDAPGLFRRALEGSDKFNVAAFPQNV